MLFDASDDQLTSLVTSELTLAEVLVLPLSKGAEGPVATYEFLVHPEGTIASHSISRDILGAAARLRADSSYRLADAIHLATARSASCDYFLTEDQRLGRSLRTHPTWIRLSDLTI